MPYHEEPESQVETPLHGFTDDMKLSPRVDRSGEIQQEQKFADCPQDSIRGSVPEVIFIESPSGSPRCNDSMSLVEETQFVDVELDTQGTDAYDVSPTTRRAMDNMVLAPIAEAPVIMKPMFLERQPVESLDLSSFRFGVPPKADNFKLSRPLPSQPAWAKAQEVFTSKSLDAVTRKYPPRVKSPPATTSDIPGHGKSPTSLNNNNDEEAIYVTENDTKNVPKADKSSTPYRTEADQMPIRDTQHDTAKVFSNAKANLGPNPSRSQQISMGPPFQELTRSLPNTNKSRHVPLIPHSSDNFNHLSHKQQSTSLSAANPSDQLPSNDFMISRANEHPKVEIRAHDASPHPFERQRRPPKPQNIRKPESRGLTPGDTVESASSAVRKVIDTFGENKLASNSHNSEKDVEVRETQCRTLPNHSYDRAVHTGATLEITSQRPGSPLSSPDQDRLSSNGVKGNGPRFSKRDVTKLPVSRPLQSTDLQPVDAYQGHDLQASRKFKVTKRPHLRTKESSQNQDARSVLPTARGTISSVEMLQMVAVMAHAERDKLEAALTTNMIREDQIKSLDGEVIVLKESIRKLELDNGNLMGNVANFDHRARAFKDHCNEVVRAQKQLRKSADEWQQQRPHIVRQMQQEIDAIRDAAEAHAQKVLQTFSGKTTEMLKEARLKLDSQEQMIEVLKRDLNNRLLDLQRERRVAESLRKQLDDNCAQHEQIKNLLLQHHANTSSHLDVQEAQIAEGLDTSAEQGVRMDECLLVMHGLKKSGAKTLPALEGLSSQVKSLSITVEDRLKVTEDGTNSLRKAGEEVLAEFNIRLSGMSDDREAQQRLNQRIESLLEDNATLKERVLGRERERANITCRLDETLQELQTSRDQLTSTTERLRDTLAAPPEDPILRRQFLGLQENYSTLNGQLMTFIKEAENTNATLREKDESSRLMQEQMAELQLKLKQDEVKILHFETEKEAYGQKKDEDLKTLRMQMERDFQARLSDDDARHGGIVSGLRRQICDYEGKTAQIQRELDAAQQMSSNNAEVAGALRADIAVLETRTGQQAVQLTRLDEELRSKGEKGVTAAAELSLSRNQIVRYEEEIDEWRAKAESNSAHYTKSCSELDKKIKMSDEVAKTEIDALNQELDGLRERTQVDDALKVAVIGSLQELGIIDRGRCLEDFILDAKHKCLREGRATEDNNLLDNGKSFSRPISSGQEAPFNYPPRPTNVGSSPRTGGQLSRGNGDMPLPNTSDTIYTCSETSNGEDPLPSAVRSTSPAIYQNEDIDWDLVLRDSSGEWDLNDCPTNLDSRSTPKRQQVDNSFTCPNEHGRLCHLSATNESGSAGQFHIENAPGLDPSARAVIPSSQGEMVESNQSQITRLARRVAQRKASIVASPRTQEANRTVTRTKVTEYSVKMSKTYEATPPMRKEKSGIMTIGKPMGIARSTMAGGSSSSPLSSPPSEFDFSEYLEEPEEQSSKDAIRQQNIEEAREILGTSYLRDDVPQASRPREALGVRDMLPPKSILKHTKSTSQSMGVVYQAHKGRTESVAERHPKVTNVLNKSGGKKRLPHPSANVNGSQHSPYNRIVSGRKDADKVSQLEGQHQSLGQVSPTSDLYSIDSSQVKAPPLGHTRKRSRFSVEMEDHGNPTKLQRLNRP